MNKLMTFLAFVLCLSVTRVGFSEQIAYERYPVSVSAFSEEGTPLPDVENKLSEVLNRLGYAVEKEAFIGVEGRMSIIDRKDITGISPKVFLTIRLELLIKDAEENRVLTTISFTSKGIGDNEKQAIQRSIEQLVDARKLEEGMRGCQGDFLRIKQRREQRSKEYLEQAKKLIKERKYRPALRKLKGVYPGTPYFDEAQRLIEEIGEEVPRLVVVILEFQSHDRSLSSQLRNALKTTLIQVKDPVSGKRIFDVAERDVPSEILKEQISKSLDPRTASSIGQAIGADLILYGSMSSKDGEIEVDAYLVDVETSLDVMALYTRKPRTELRAIAKDIADQIVANIDELDKMMYKSSELEIDKKRVEELLSKIQKPRIMILIPEWHIHRPIPDPAAETEMIRKFITTGFKTVDQAQVKKIRDTEEARAAALGDSKASAAIGRRNGAEIIITGEAFSENVPREISGFHMCRARIEARAVECDTGTIIAAGDIHASGADLTEGAASKKALQRAGGFLAEILMAQIVNYWDQKSKGLFEIELSVRQIDFDQLIQLESALKAQEGIVGINRRSFEDGVALIELESKNPAQKVAENIAKAEFNGFKARVESFTANKIGVLIERKR